MEVFKDSYKENALKALKRIHLRACYDLIPEIIVSANSLLYLGIPYFLVSLPSLTGADYKEREKQNAPPPKPITPR